MARVKPFRGIHPRPDNAANVVSRSYDSYSKDRIEAILHSNQESFLNVIRPDIVTHEKFDANTPELFSQSKQV